MTNNPLPSLASGLLTLLLSSVVHASIIPINSSLQLTASTRADPNLVSVTETSTDSQGATLNALAVSASATSIGQDGSISVSGAIDASFDDASQGSITFTRLGWQTDGVILGFANLINGSDWDYTFTATKDGQLILSWDITSTGRIHSDQFYDPFGLNGFLLEGIGSSQSLEIDTSGTLTRSIVAGTTYTFSLDNGANIAGGISQTAFMTGNFEWRITQVPEPATLALFGLGLLGLVASRGRKQ